MDIYAWLKEALGSDDRAEIRAEIPAEVLAEVIAVGWATVDLDRAAADLGGTWRPAADDRLLGARAWTRTQASNAGATAIILLEPNTEGRLAGALARHGEGPVAIYLRSGASQVAGSAGPEAAPSAVPAHARAGDGPFGRERLNLDGPLTGPFVLTVGDPEQVPSEP